MSKKYALVYSGKYYCDWHIAMGQSGWKLFEDAWNILIDDLEMINWRRHKLSLIYVNADIKVVELTDQQLQDITFMKLKKVPA